MDMHDKSKETFGHPAKVNGFGSGTASDHYQIPV